MLLYSFFLKKLSLFPKRKYAGIIYRCALEQHRCGLEVGHGVDLEEGHGVDLATSIKAEQGWQADITRGR